MFYFVQCCFRQTKTFATPNLFYIVHAPDTTDRMAVTVHSTIESAPVAVGAQAPPDFDGCWRSRDGTLITILGNRVDARSPNGRLQHVGTLGSWSGDTITMILRKAPGKMLGATVSSSGELQWCDGDVWSRGHGAAAGHGPTEPMPAASDGTLRTSA